MVNMKLTPSRCTAVIMLVIFALLVIVPATHAQDVEPPGSQDFISRMVENLALEFLPVLAMFAVGYLVNIGGQLWNAYRADKPYAANAIESAAFMAVKAAEQAGAAGFIQNKKQYALEAANAMLKANGLKIDIALIAAAVEAAVYEQFNKDRPSPSNVPEVTVTPGVSL